MPKQTMSMPSATERKFRELAECFYGQTFERFPIEGSVAGRHEFDGDMGRSRPAEFENQKQLVEKTLAAVEDLPMQDFSADGMLDRRALLANLRSEYLQLGELSRWRNDPQMHINSAATAIHHLLARHAQDLAPVAGAIYSRLKKIPRYLDDAAECVHRPDPLWQQLAARNAPAVANMFRQIEPELAKVLPNVKRPVLAKVIREAADAANAYAERIRRVKPAYAGSFAIGEERFKRMMRDRLGLDWSPREAASFARRHAEWLAGEMRAEARRIDGRRSPEEILEKAAADWQPCGSLIEAYRKSVGVIRDQFAEAGWIDFPKGEKLLVLPVPEFMRDQFPTAAYSSPGALDPDQTGIFWVNDLGASAGSAKGRAAETAQHFGIELTCAHEAYPGHHLQFIIQNRHPSLARRMAHHAVYYEGWTLWCEQMMADLGALENPYLRLIQLHDELWRTWRVVIDVGLQTGAMTYESACRTLQREVGFTPNRARGDVNWYTSSPVVPMSYLIGKLEVMRLKRRRVDSGEMTLREFNNWLLSFGAIPWRWIEESGI
ncbi:DUF885 domain-containing protein [bacterium]|nr:DUF885 domain-containing protein [bacterium]